MPIYLQLDGIPGDATHETHETHEKWMDIEAIHWNVSRNMNTAAGSAANREASEPTVSVVVLTKVSDSSSTKLFQEACTGRTGRTGKLTTIHLVTTAGLTHETMRRALRALKRAPRGNILPRQRSATGPPSAWLCIGAQ